MSLRTKVFVTVHVTRVYHNFKLFSNLFSLKNRGKAKREARRDMTKPNLVPRVLGLFGQREFARGSREIGQNRERCLICEDIQRQ